ncbi:MAG: helix-turn-helix domain-containing protein [Saprospiraceae bacterium]
MDVNWLEQFILFGAMQGFLLALVVSRMKSSNRIIKILLGSLLVLTSFTLIGRVFFQTEYLQMYWMVYTYADIIIFLFGPIIYFFTCSLLGKKLPPRSKLLRHFWPALIHFLVVNTFLSLAFQDVITFVTGLHFILIYSTLEFLAIVSLGFYLWKSIKLFNQYELEYFSNYSSPNVHSFLKHFLYFFLVILGLWMVAFLLKSINLVVDNYGSVYYGFWTLGAISTYFLSYKILLDAEILKAPKLEEPKTIDEITLIQTPISQEFLNTKGQLSYFLETKKIYQNPNLSLNDLAEAMQINRHDLSKTINQGFNKNFFDLINSYRIQEFIEKYDTKYTFLEIAFEVGFNSKSAFNRAFRKETGTNPSTYFKNQIPFQKVNT